LYNFHFEITEELLVAENYQIDLYGESYTHAKYLEIKVYLRLNKNNIAPAVTACIGL